MSNELNLEKYVPAAGGVTMFTTSWCGYCRNLKRLMDQKSVAYTEVNIEEVEGTAQIVESFNNGNQTVPTLIFPDGTAATNPRIEEVVERVGA